MFKSLALFSLLTALATANAQTPDLSQTSGLQPAGLSQAAPIVRSYPSYHSALRQPRHLENQIVESQPVSGVWLRSESSSGVATLSATPKHTEIRLDRGRLNVSVHHPAEHAEILVDLPGGQVSLFKDGLYTFNADTGTVRVLRGEAAAYPGPVASTAGAAYPGPVASTAGSKPIKIKEDHQLSLVAADTKSGTLVSGDLRSVEAYPYELTADLLPLNARGYEDGVGSYGDGGSSYGEGYGYAPYPYAYYAGAWGYPGYYGYPFAYGIGFGYYGGFGGGYGYRGGFRR